MRTAAAAAAPSPGARMSRVVGLKCGHWHCGPIMMLLPRWRAGATATERHAGNLHAPAGGTGMQDSYRATGSASGDCH